MGNKKKKKNPRKEFKKSRVYLKDSFEKVKVEKEK